ncbi:hypothetical protein AAG906_021252 [Vitis piasezkii]
MACSQYTMSPINSKMNQSWIPDLFGSGDGTGDCSGDCSIKSMGSELSTLGFFCIGRPPDLVRYRLAGGFGGAGFTGGGIGLDGEGSGAESGSGSFRRLFVRFEGDEDLALVFAPFRLPNFGRR